ncbi:MAG: 1-deoxy-D-xylulose-5-phosphate reductoisomerase [Dehalococcoidia bacterium]
MKRLAILGSTGSVGRQTLDVVRSFPGEFEIVALCAGQNGALLDEQIDEFHPSHYYLESGAHGSRNGASATPPQEIVCMEDVDLVVAATVGCAGMRPMLAALEAGKTVALANKEVVVMAGQILLEATRKHGSVILPVDSEPSAIWQCLQGEEAGVQRLIITASGGAFRDRTWSSLGDVSPEQALKHPTWEMGQKITIDSATLMNKAFEVIESRWLFDIPFEQIDVVIHRQSIIHSMVEFRDGVFKAQLGAPDMRFPIQYAMFYPDRRKNLALPRFNPVETGSLTFEAMDRSLYPCFQIAMDYGRRGGSWPAVLAGADEAAVALFLAGKIRFTDLPDVVEATLSEHTPCVNPSIEDLIDAANWGTRRTLERHRRN